MIITDFFMKNSIGCHLKCIYTNASNNLLRSIYTFMLLVKKNLVIILEFTKFVL